MLKLKTLTPHGEWGVQIDKNNIDRRRAWESIQVAQWLIKANVRCHRHASVCIEQVHGNARAGIVRRINQYHTETQSQLQQLAESTIKTAMEKLQ